MIIIRIRHRGMLYKFIIIWMSHRPSVDSTGTMFFTKYSDPSQCTFIAYLVDHTDRKRFRSTFQASRIGDQKKMDEIEQMFNNYNLFKHGQFTAPPSKRRNSLKNYPSQDIQPKHKNMRDRIK